MTVIADTSPRQYLFQVGLLHLLHDLFVTILVPVAVRDELQVGKRLGFDVPEPAAYPWMVVRSTTHSPAISPFGLGAGERGVLALALELGDCLVVLDDAAARTAAERLGFATTGTLGVLLLAKERQLLPAVAPVIASLDVRGFRIAELTRRRVLQLAGE